MINYDDCKMAACMRTDTVGSISIIIGRRLPNGLFSLAVFLVDLWKLGLKDAWGQDRLDAGTFKETVEETVNGMALYGAKFISIDINDAKRLISLGARIAEAVGTPQVDKTLLETVGSLEGFKTEGSLYKCFECEQGELNQEDCDRILKIAKRELKSGISGTPEEEQIHFECAACKGD